MTGRLQDKVALVFGAGCVGEGWGNGSATASLFAKEGACVIAADINEASVRSTVDRITADGGKAIAVRADVTSAADVQAAVDAGLREYGRIDILHNNVGINVFGGPMEVTEEQWDAVLATNVKSLLLACKAVIPVFQKQGGGSIINISSTAGQVFFGRPMIAYASSKAAVNQFTRALAVEYAAENIRCNCIVPGVIDTPRTQGLLSNALEGDMEEVNRRRSASVPMKRLGSPWDIANAALFLASDEASYISGVVIAVDGALTCAAPSSA